MPTFRPLEERQSTKDYNRKVKNFADFGKTLVDGLTTTNVKDAESSLGVLSEYGVDFRRTKKTKDGLTFEIFDDNTKEYKSVDIDFKKNDLYGTVERILQKTLGRNSKIDISDIMDSMGGREFFKGKSISDIEALFAPKEIKEVLEVDSPENIMQNPINPYNPDTGKVNLVTLESMIQLVENNEYEEKDLPKYIKGILVQQGLDEDIMIEIGEAGRTIGSVGRLFGAEADERFAVIKKNNKEIERINLTDIEKEFRDEIKRITKQSQREGTFYEGDDSVAEKQYANFQEYKVDFPEGTLAEFKIYKESQNHKVNVRSRRNIWINTRGIF